MKHFLFAALMLFSLGTYANPEPVVPTEINFEEGNFFEITSQFNGTLLNKFAEKVLTYEGDELYIYFDTPGGSVIALSRMARLMKGSKIKFTCIANFAASAGFMLFQHCDNRLLLSDGILMSHNWAGSFRDEAPRILTFFNTITNLVGTLEAVVIEKLNINAAEYATLINSNLWMTSVLATKYNAIDGVINAVSCSSKLLEQRNPVYYRSFFGGSGTYYKSGCPLVQTVYKKIRNKNTDTYIETDRMLFTQSQSNYVMESANWIYMGKRNF